MEYTITSKNNKLIKHIKALHRKNYRDKTGQFFIEGIKVVKEAYERKVNLHNIIVCPEILKKVNGGEEFLTYIFNNNIPIFFVPINIFKEISGTDNPQGVLAVVSKSNQTFTELNHKGMYILLDGVQDPGNLGTIIRTADAVGVDGVVLSSGCVDAYNLKTLRATAGSIFRVRIFEKVNLPEFVKDMQQMGMKIIVASLQSNQYYFNIKYSKGLGIVIGNEANGVSKKMLELADHIVSIPMKEGVDSLNAAIAASVIMYEVVRQQMVHGF